MEIEHRARREYIRGRMDVHRQLIGDVQGYWFRLCDDTALSPDECALVGEILLGLETAAIAIGALSPSLIRAKKQAND